MKVPREKMRLSSSHGGQTRARGWLVINIRGMDLEGVNELVISMEEIEKMAAAGPEQDETLTRVRDLLGG